jgi:hypothetical protein
MPIVAPPALEEEPPIAGAPPEPLEPTLPIEVPVARSPLEQPERTMASSEASIFRFMLIRVSAQRRDES